MLNFIVLCRNGKKKTKTFPDYCFTGKTNIYLEESNRSQEKTHLQRKKPGSSPELGRSPGGGNGNTLQHSCLGKPIDRGAWQATTDHGVSKSWTPLSD